MFISKRIFLSASLTSTVLFYSCIGHAFATATLPSANVSSSSESTNNFLDINKSSFYIGLLYIEPSTNNLRYATLVSGTQPYYQSWHYQEIEPGYHPAVELGLTYAIPHSSYNVAIDWLHLNSNDSASTQASTNVSETTLEFVGPPYEMSPPVFGIKAANSKVNFDFDNVLLDVGKIAEYGSHIQARFYGGLDFLKLNQTITTTFGDYAGALVTPYSYPLPPDPSFSFQTKNESKYLGAGPGIGLDLRYTTDSGFGVLGDVLGLLTVGSIKTQDNFTSTSARLTSAGIGTSYQQITSPTDTQVVFGADAKLGVFYNFPTTKSTSFSIEAGYRIATFVDAISTIAPNTLVQPGTNVTTPEFSTGTMAIVSTRSQSSPFNFNGFFLNLKASIA